MRHSIRISIFISFIFLSVFLSGCGRAVDADRKSANAGRPLATPAIVADRPKIIAFGDSLTAGFGLAEKESYPFLLQERLKSDGFNYEVVNAGVSGDTTLGGLERSDWVLEQENAKILILELGANDLLRGIPVAKVKGESRQDNPQGQGSRISRSSSAACSLRRPWRRRISREFVLAFPDLASQHKVQFLPFLLENIATKKELNQSDGIHPNAEGEKIMTDNVYAALRPMLQ